MYSYHLSVSGTSNSCSYYLLFLRTSLRYSDENSFATNQVKITVFTSLKKRKYFRNIVLIQVLAEK